MGIRNGCLIRRFNFNNNLSATVLYCLLGTVNLIMKVWIHKHAPRAWYKYWRPLWLNKITWKQGDTKIYRWLFWGYCA